jgi:hypothetical protein
MTGLLYFALLNYTYFQYQSMVDVFDWNMKDQVFAE